MNEIAAPAEVQYAYRFEYADKSAFVVYPDGRAFITFPDGRAPEQKFGKIDNRIPSLIGQAAKPRQDEIEKLRNQLVRTRQGVQDFLDGNYENPRKHKVDLGDCKHGLPWYRDCGSCDADHFIKLLSETDEQGN